MNDKGVKIVFTVLALALFGLTQYTIGLQRKCEYLQRQARLFNDQIYGTFMAGCQGGVNNVMLNILTHAPFADDVQENCRLNAGYALENFKKSQEDAK